MQYETGWLQVWEIVQLFLTPFPLTSLPLAAPIVTHNRKEEKVLGHAALLKPLDGKLIFLAWS